MDTQKAYQSIHQRSYTKSADINELTLAIQTILKGGQYLCKRFKTILNRMQTEEQIKEQLTLREMEVLQAIAKGFNTREIADLTSCFE